jgi:hypothetical protein
MGRVRDLEDERFMTGLPRASFGVDIDRKR